MVDKPIEWSDIKGDKFVWAMVSSRTIREVSDKLNISENTVYRWLKDPIIQERLAEAREVMRQTTMDRIMGMSDLALNKLERLLEQDDDNNNQMKAVRTYLEYAMGKNIRVKEEKTVRHEGEVTYKIDIPGLKKIEPAEVDDDDPEEVLDAHWNEVQSPESDEDPENE